MSRKVPDGWKKCKLGDIVRLNPYSIDSNFKYSQIVYLDTGSIKEGKITELKEYKLTDAPSRAKRLVKNNNIIYSTVCPIQRHYGIIKNPPDNMVVSNGFVVLEAIEEIIDPYFLYYFLTLDKIIDTLEAIAEASSSVYPTFRIPVLENLTIFLPPLPEQRAIASIFPPIEDKIELLRQENETLYNMINTLFKQWFIKDLESKEVLLKDVYVFEKGFEPGSSNYLEVEEEDTIRFIRVKDMDDENPSVFIKKNLAKNICNPNDLLVAFDGSPGKIGFGVEGAFSSGIRKVYSDNKTYNNVWLKYLIFKSKPIQNTIKAYSTGTIIQHAGSCIDKLIFKFPEESKIKEFNKLITPIFSKIQFNKQQICTLTQLRDTLLPKLMSGKIRVV